MKKVTVVWNKHAEGHLVGVFDDENAVEEFKKLVKDKGESHYIIFFDVEVNKINETELIAYLG